MARVFPFSPFCITHPTRRRFPQGGSPAEESCPPSPFVREMWRKWCNKEMVFVSCAAWFAWNADESATRFAYGNQDAGRSCGRSWFDQAYWRLRMNERSTFAVHKDRAGKAGLAWLLLAIWLLLVILASSPSYARVHAKESKDSLEHYLKGLSSSQDTASPSATTGSLWRDQSPFAAIASDVKARRLHDLITIAVSEQTLAQAAGDVTAQRDYSASSGISALGAHISTGGVSQLFSPTSSMSVKGKGQSDSNSTLQTTLAGEVVALLPNGNMVVEARRSVKMNNEQRTITLRGIVRPADVSPANVVSSTALAHLEIELKGKGVVSDGTRPNNLGIRWLWKVLGF